LVVSAPAPRFGATGMLSAPSVSLRVNVPLRSPDLVKLKASAFEPPT